MSLLPVLSAFVIGVAAASEECPSGLRILDTEYLPGSAKGTDPPRDMPPSKERSYSRCGAIPIEKYYVADGKSSYKYDRADIDGRIAHWKRMLEVPQMQSRLQPNMKFLVSALQKHASEYIKDQRVLVYGAMDPSIETLCLALGATEVLTVEHNSIGFEHPQLPTVTAEEFGKQQQLADRPLFRAAVSQSSFDHDGLGRYGDPLNADADLASMDRAMQATQPGGVLFLPVPVGPDVVVWNLHRRYGARRLPLLLDGWERLDDVGYEDAKLTAPANFKRSYEPVFVLRRPAVDPSKAPSEEL